MDNEPVDEISGECLDGEFRFRRTRERVFEQINQGDFTDRNNSEITGTFSHNGAGSRKWYGAVKRPKLPFNMIAATKALVVVFRCDEPKLVGITRKGHA